MEYLLGLLAVVVGGLLYSRSKASQAEERSKFLEHQLKLSSLQQEQTVNDALIKAEEELRKANIEKKDATPEENADFFNKL